MATNKVIPIQLKTDAPTVLFTASSKCESVITVEIQNPTLSNRLVNFYVIRNITDRLTDDKKLSLTVPANSKAKKRNILIPSGLMLVAVGDSALLVARSYIPSLYAIPGEFDMNGGGSATVQIFLAANVGEKKITVVNKDSGTFVEVIKDKVSNGFPASFKIGRLPEATGRTSLQFIVEDLKVGTTIEIDSITGEVEDWSDIQMAMFYKQARDIEIKNNV